MAKQEWDMPDDVDTGKAGNYLDKEGTFHFSVESIEDCPDNKDGWKVSLAVLDGTVRENGVCTEVGKTVDLWLWNPKLNGKDGGKWARLKQARFLIATGLVDESKKGQKVSFDLEDAKDRQIIAKLQLGEPNDQGKRYLEWAYADIFHVDDPAVKDSPKSAKAIGLLPKSMRRQAGSFAKDDKKPQAQTQKRETVASASSSSVSSDLGDL